MDAPLGVITELCPVQIVLLLTDAIATVGVVFTVIVVEGFVVALEAHPPKFDPLIVYVVVLVGVTVKLVPVVPIGISV